MPDVPLAILPAPQADYLTLSELTTWLGLKDERTVRKHIRLGHIPQGKPRAGTPRLYWDKVAAAIARWNLDNLERYERSEDEADKPPDKSSKRGGENGT